MKHETAQEAWKARGFLIIRLITGSLCLALLLWLALGLIKGHVQWATFNDDVKRTPTLRHVTGSPEENFFASTSFGLMLAGFLLWACYPKVLMHEKIIMWWVAIVLASFVLLRLSSG